MRLPADAVLIVVDAPAVVDGLGNGPDGGSDVARNIAALVDAWRAEALPLVRTDRQSSPSAAPLAGEIVLVRAATSAFVGSDLEAKLDELGATTLVFCGTLGSHALEASVRHGGDLGYQVFVPADACEASDLVDFRGVRWSAEDLRALALTGLKGESATIVDTATTLRAAATAKARQRRAARRA